MNNQERERLWAFRRREDIPMCVTCAHFEQHYYRHVFGHFEPMDEGHCVYPRIKCRRPYDLCDHYKRKE